MFKEDGQEYAQVVKMLGNGRLEAKCFDGPIRLAHIRGKLRKKVWSELSLDYKSLPDATTSRCLAGGQHEKHMSRMPLLHQYMY